MSKEMAAMVVQLSPYVTPLDIQEFTATYWISNGIVKLTRDAREKYGLLKSFYCTSCDNRLANSKAFCQTEGCEIQAVAPKRSRSSKRASIFTVRIEPQLTSILQRDLQLLVELHTTIHSPDGSDVNPVLSETSSFPQYLQEIESFSRFRNSEITVVLTMSVDGVRFKKLSRSEAWPIYIRLEGLPSKEKNKYENIMLAGILFARNTPTERLFSELFSRLKHELTALEAGIPIQLVTPASTSTWICTPKLTHGIIDFGILVRVFEKPELTALDFRGCRDLANSMKLLWYEIELALITLKVPCFIDHAILQDLPHIGTPYNWSSSSFESVHRRLQLRVAQCTTKFEEKITNDFLLHKDVIKMLENEVELMENQYFDRLCKKVLQGRKSRDEFVAGNHYLEIGWYVPKRSVLPFQDLRPEH
ncbi:unnamed protein product [Nippostrongylus brasiliensis]|uniref:DUF1758 domain-containing protein n=1 Tax=Nippostrongylus brasiliensis TaxID=27835 RepID=A0A0N4YP12_NIPBR|nr:unnamed protein product [Nippostrongylus brasiliensis]